MHVGRAADPSAALTDLVNALTSASSAAYSALLPTADIINCAGDQHARLRPVAVHGTLADGGDLLDAFGLPIAADTALVTLAAGFEVEVLQNTISADRRRTSRVAF